MTTVCTRGAVAFWFVIIAYQFTVKTGEEHAQEIVKGRYRECWRFSLFFVAGGIPDTTCAWLNLTCSNRKSGSSKTRIRSYGVNARCLRSYILLDNQIRIQIPCYFKRQTLLPNGLVTVWVQSSKGSIKLLCEQMPQNSANRRGFFQKILLKCRVFYIIWVLHRCLVAKCNQAKTVNVFSSKNKNNYR